MKKSGVHHKNGLRASSSVLQCGKNNDKEMKKLSQRLVSSTDDQRTKIAEGVISYSALDDAQRLQGKLFMSSDELAESSLKIKDSRSESSKWGKATESKSELINSEAEVDNDEDEEEEEEYISSPASSMFRSEHSFGMRGADTLSVQVTKTTSPLCPHSCSTNNTISAGTLVDFLPNELLVNILLHLIPTELCLVKGLSSFWFEFIKMECLWTRTLPVWLDVLFGSSPKWKEKGLRIYWAQKGLRPPVYAFQGLLHYYFPDDPCAREFWREKFPNSIMEGIEWMDFAKSFYGFVKPKTEPIFTVEQLENANDPRILDNPIPLLDYRCFKSTLCRTIDKEKCERSSTRETSSNADCIVSIETFSAVLKWFGPLSPTYHYNRQNLLTRIRKTLKYSAFQGFVSSAALKKMLEPFPAGTFAIRFSETTPGYFVLARVLRDGKVTEGRMYWDNKKGFTVGNYSARTLNKFCRDLRKKLNLQYICGKRRYESLFELPEVEEDDEEFNMCKGSIRT